MRRGTPGYIKVIARELRKNETSAESVLWEYLRNRKLEGLKFKRQYGIGRYIADFYCSEKKIVIELDGNIHLKEDIKVYDEIRERDIKLNKINVIRFTNDEVYNNIQKVLEQIKESCIFPSPEVGEGARG